LRPFRWEGPLEVPLFVGEAWLSHLRAGEQLLYTPDMGDDRTHLRF
jgi:hypothetical protein